MAEFKPYSYIKEFYNSERLIMPAVRDSILNGLFVGGSQAQGETILDNINTPFFDLWTTIINMYRYSFFETIRGELIVVPEMMSCLPPLCNVVFPDEYLHYGRKIDLRNVTTRYYEQGFMTLAGNDGQDVDFGNYRQDERQLSQEAFFAPTTDIEPLVHKILASECSPKKVPSANSEDGDFEVYSQIPLPEEFHYGANYRTGAGEYLTRISEDYVRRKQDGSADTQGEDSPSLIQEYNDYHRLNVLYKYFLTRMQSQKTEQIKLTFTPRLIAGLPILLFSRRGTHLMGLLSTVTHQISADGVAETYITVEFQYMYDDVTKRPIYTYRQETREKDIQQGTDSSEEDTYLWKNYQMLSSYFRDKYIGEKMYSPILCDGIDDLDYNRSALKNLKDKSIIGIHNVFKYGNYDKQDVDAGKLQFLTDESFNDDNIKTGEVIAVSTETNSLHLSNNMVAQRKKMTAAVDKIWRGYNDSYDKNEFRDKFDIYPMRDFDSWMASLGAKRNAKGNYEGVGPKTEWVQKVRDEVKERYAAYQELENKRKANIMADTANKITDEFRKYQEAEKKREEFNSKTKNTNPTPLPDGKTPDVHPNRDDVNPDVLIKKAEENIKNLVKSVSADSEEQVIKDLGVLTSNNYFKKYDLGLDEGKLNRTFTTQGPFCLEKQKYFLEVYKNIPNHFNTEFRTAEHNENIKPKDKGNDLINIVHGIGETPQ